jgi:HK97 family phage major capsid protein
MNPVWFCHKRFFWNVMARLQLALGGNNYVDLGAGPVLQFLGYPVQFTQVLPSTTSASAKVCYLGDLSMGTTLGLRRQMSVIADTSRFVEFLQTAFISHMRWDYNVHETGTASLPGPIVCVQAAA